MEDHLPIPRRMCIDCPYLCGVLVASLPDNGCSGLGPFEVFVQGVGGAQRGCRTGLYIQQECLSGILMLCKRIHCLIVDSELATAVRNCRRATRSFDEPSGDSLVSSIQMRVRQPGICERKERWGSYSVKSLMIDATLRTMKRSRLCFLTPV